MTSLVVLPSFNESNNIVDLIEAILRLPEALEVCVVDDSSPDGTGEVLREAIAARPAWSKSVRLMVREGKGGRGSAVRHGLEWGVSSGRFSSYIEMDCDFSHDPSELPAGRRLLDEGYDVVIGARYPDGTIIGWPLIRRFFSRLANYLARILLKWSIPDYTNGFRFYSARATTSLLAADQRHPGFIYLSETLAVLLRAGMTVTEFPITFRNRARGVSNTGPGELLAALRGIFAIAWRYHTIDRWSRR